MTHLIPISCKLPESIADKLDACALEHGITRSSAAAAILTGYVTGKPVRLAQSPLGLAGCSDETRGAVSAAGVNARTEGKKRRRKRG